MSIDESNPKNWSREKLINHQRNQRALIVGFKRKIDALTDEVKSLITRVELAEREVRDLALNLSREKQRADEAEAKLKSMGHT